MNPYRFAGRTAVLTGAAGGIGEQLAYGLAARGSDLVLVDRDADRLDEVAGRIHDRYPRPAVRTFVADLADRAAVLDLADRILAGHPGIGLLVNNAGVALGGHVDQVGLDDIDWVMAVNFRAPVILMHRLLPALTAAPGGHIVNVSSLYGLIAPPGQAAYAASKFALRGFSQALRAELAPRGVGVTTVHPGGIRTGIARSARIGAGVPRDEADRQQQGFERLLTYPADRAAREILDAVARRRPRLLIAASARIPDVLARLLPVGHQRLLDLAAAAVMRGGSRPHARRQRTGAAR